MQNDNHYRTLGLSPGATPEQIKAAFKPLAMQFHPDRNPGNPLAEEQFKKIIQAYEVLSDPEKKKLYDLKLSGYTDFIHLRTAREQTEHYRKRYGSGKRPYTREQMEAMLLSEYDRAMKRLPLRWRYLISFLLIGIGGQWAVFHIERVDTGIYVFYMLGGYVLLLLGIYMLYKTVYIYLRARFLRKEIKSYYDGPLIIAFFLLLFTGAGMTVVFSNLRRDYHLEHYQSFTTGELTEVHDSYIVYKYTTGRGEIEKSERIGLSDIQYYSPGGFLIIMYSYKDPFIARVYKGKDEKKP